MVTNRRTAEDDGIDFYPSPEWCVEALLDNEKFSNGVWEPACGDGAISKVLERYNYKPYSTDLHDHGYTKLDEKLDFLTHDYSGKSDIITNPPYNIINEFTLKALSTKQRKTALLVRLAFLEGQERHDDIFSKYPPARIYVFSERITMYKKYAKNKKGSGTTAYCWVVWDREHTGDTVVKWLRGYKPKGLK